MKTRLLCTLILCTVAPVLHAAPQTSQIAKPIPLTLRKVEPPILLVKKLGGAKVLQSGIAALGPNRESCWAFWLRPKSAKGKTAPSVFSVWKPTGKNRWAKVGDWPLGTTEDFGEAELAWLNSKTRTGWVMSYYVQYQGGNLIAFPRGAKTPKKGLVHSGPYGSNSTSIYATYYEFGSDEDKRGFYTVTKVYSEPGRDNDGNTITVEDRTIYYWNGSGWGHE